MPDAMGRGIRPLRMALFYASFGTTWILVTDYVVDWLLAGHSHAQTVKGLLFVAASAALVYWLARRAAARAAAAQLQRTQHLLEQTLASVADGVLVVDSRSRTILECNPAAERIFGYSKEELIGQSTEMLHVDRAHYQNFGTESTPVLHQTGSFHTSYQMKRKDGTLIDAEISVAALHPELGPAHSVVSVIRDITEQRAAQAFAHDAEKKTRDIAARLEQLVEQVPDAVYIKDGDLNYIMVNEAVCTVTGKRREDLIGYDDYALFDQQTAARIIESDRRIMAEGTIRTFEEVNTDQYGNTTHYISTKGAMLDSEGQPVGLFGISHDITAERELQEALQERMKELRTLYEATRCLARFEEPLQDRLAAVVNLIPSGWLYPDITAARIEFEGWTSSTPGFRETPWMQSSPIQCFDAAAGRIDVALLEARPGKDEGPFLKEERALLDSLARAAGRAAERHRLEEQYRQAQKMESVGRLAGGVAHDFNNMLSVILGHTEMILMKQVSPELLHEELEEVHRAARRAADLTQQLLAFSRQDIARPVLLDWNESIGQHVEMLSRLSADDVTIDWQPGAGPLIVHIDPVQSQQILVNLVLNAADAIEGAGAITIKTTRTTLNAGFQASHDTFTPGAYAQLTVSDTGAGMDPVTASKAFEPFFTTKPPGKGTGLGLATVYGIVTQHGGHVEVYSKPDAGTTFTIYLPLRTEAAEVEQAPRERGVPEAGAETILLVEDEKQLLQLNERTVGRLGYTVLVANAPEEAVEKVRDYPDPIDLVVTDVIMPGMNGHELYGELEKLRPGLRCLFISGYSAEVIAERGILRNDVHFLQKPFTARDLASKIREALDS